LRSTCGEGAGCGGEGEGVEGGDEGNDDGDDWATVVKAMAVKVVEKKVLVGCEAAPTRGVQRST